VKKQKPVKKPAPSRRPAQEPKSRKKLHFEDGVRAALVAAVVVCAAVLGAGGFFVVRSALSKGFNPPAVSLDGEPEQINPSPELNPQTPTEIDILPELDQAIRDLEAGGSGAAPVPQAGAARHPSLPAERRGILVLVIDDAGNNLQELSPFLNFPGPLTIAVLPGLPNSVEAAKRVRASGKELFLHQPMEPLNGQNPGPGAIKTGMTPAEVKAVLVQNLNEVGPVAGFNNHEGSKATMDKTIMGPLLEVARDGSLVFLDSRTIADTAGPAVARELGISIAQRDIFLDNEQDRESIIAALEEGCKKAEQNGTAVLIGHAWSPRLAAILTEYHPILVQRGFFFTTVSGILDPGK
jgi:polysaccharide deacetylase 2 family uncharacterized protein YibQ